jgi:hypothetical protein
MSRWTLDVFDPEAGRITPLSLAAETTDLALLPIDGADAIFALLRCDGEPRCCAELPVAAGERAELRISLGRQPFLASSGSLLLLPPVKPPPAPPQARPPGRGLDLALLIDATWQYSNPEQGGAMRLLGDAEAWSRIASALTLLVAGLAFDPSTRVAVLGFGDAGLPHPAAADLQPAFVVAPAPRGFEPFDKAPLTERLRGLPPSSGGDLVDSVAEGLAATCELPWHPEHRKLVLLAGDSPGYSILHPAPGGAAAFARAADVDEIAAGLFERGIEIATHCAPAKGLQPAARQIFDYTRAQYRRLASLPGWALGMDDLSTPQAAARHLLGRPEWLARGAAAGILERVGG